MGLYTSPGVFRSGQTELALKMYAAIGMFVILVLIA